MHKHKHFPEKFWSNVYENLPEYLGEIHFACRTIGNHYEWTHMGIGLYHDFELAKKDLKAYYVKWFKNNEWVEQFDKPEPPNKMEYCEKQFKSDDTYIWTDLDDEIEAWSGGP
eukprot:UN13005